MDSITKSEANNRDPGASIRGTVALGEMKWEEVAVSMEDDKRPEQGTVWGGTIEGQIWALSYIIYLQVFSGHWIILTSIL